MSTGDGQMEFTQQDLKFLKAIGIRADEPTPVPSFDGTSKLLEEFEIPVTRENWLAISFAGNPPEEPFDGELAAELEDIMPLWFRNEED
jgi:hypothetical protein